VRDARRVLLACAAALAALLALAAPAASATAAPAGPQAVLEEINRVRAAHGLAKLRRDARLSRASRAHALDLMRRDVFEHGDFEARMHRFAATGPRFGENIAWGAGSRGSARAVVRMWMRSPGHRANLLRPGWRRVGIGVTAGRFGGYDGVRVVAAAFAGF
jgi:uncharacterized protein YkwD